VNEPRWQGAAGLRPLLVPVESLTQDPGNTRRHGPRNLEAIRRSLASFGQRKPVVVAAGVVFAGNGTLQAALSLEWTHVAVVDASDLSSQALRAYSIADNQTSDLAEWDPEKLAASLGPLTPALQAATGFDADEMKAISTLGSQEKREPSESFASIKFTREQFTIVEGAVAKLREQEGQPDMSPARAVELLAAEYLS
jgi:hypothetical protein